MKQKLFILLKKVKKKKVLNIFLSLDLRNGKLTAYTHIHTKKSIIVRKCSKL